MKQSYRRLFVAMAAMVLVVSAGASAAENIALGKPVTPSDPALFGVPGPAYAIGAWEIPAPAIAAFSTVTDGVFLDEGHQWNMDTVWWDASANTVALDIDLQGDFLIKRFVVQADDNDQYWINLFDDGELVPGGIVLVPTDPSWGMKTREVILPWSMQADTIKFFATVGDGDSLYAISELQAFGPDRPVVPAPAAVMLLGPGLLALAALRRRIGIR